MRTPAILFCSILLFSCNQDKTQPNRFLNVANASSQFITVEVGKDMSFTMAQGMLLTIPAGSIRSDKPTVRLEVKEVYTMQQILNAGLTTESNGRPLSSGGMFFIAPAAGEDATIVKPLKVRVPVTNDMGDMKLFKGENEDGQVNWKDPQPVWTQRSTSYERGKTLFEQSCNTCHNPLKDATGPALYGADRRWPDIAHMNAFIRNSSELYSTGDAYANCLKDKWKTVMTPFPQLSDEDIADIFVYINKEAKQRLGADTVNVLRYSYDSCQAQKKRIAEMESRIDYLQTNQKPFFDLNNDPGRTDFSDDAHAAGFKGKTLVQAETYEADYYNVEITSFGWFNFDLFNDDLPGTSPSTLVVTLNGDYSNKLNLLLVVPKWHGLLQGGKLDNGAGYGFSETNGNIILPQNASAIILAFSEGSNKDELYFGMVRFTTSTKQVIQVTLSKSDSLQITRTITGLDLSDFNVSVVKDTLARERKALEVQLETEQSDYIHHCDCMDYRPEADTTMSVK